MQSYRFGEFELDLDAQQLRLRGDAVHLERRPFDLLVLLVTAQGQVVTRDDIVAKLWPTNVIIDFDSGINTLVRKARRALGDSPEKPTFIETVAGRGYRFIGPLEKAVAATAPARRSAPLLIAAVIAAVVIAAILTWWPEDPLPEHTRIAVLPLENLTGDADLDFMAAGIAEETSIALANIDLPDLSVIGVVSARALAESDVSLPEFGRELGVDFFVVSSLRLDAPRIRVTSRLLRASDGKQIWSAAFDRELTNALGLQRELSVAIAEQIRQRLSPEVAAAIDRRQTQNPAAYELYLKARYEWTQFQPGSNVKALGFYELAVAEDPRYGLAWAGMARDLASSIVTVEADREAILPTARDALQRALEFGPDLAETQLALGSFHFFIDRNLVPAEAAARKAVALDPNSAMNHMFLGVVLSSANKHVEARAMLRRARELDPLFPLTFANSAIVALNAGEPEEALEHATQAIAINPEFWVGYLHLGNAHRRLGNYEEAIEAYANAEKMSGNGTARAASLRAWLLVKLGREDEAREILANLIARSANQYVSPYYIAVVYAGLGETDAAFEWLDRAITARSISCPRLNTDSRLDSLRSDTRFASQARRCQSDLAWNDF
ncbi:MAG: tetratricopeptide repeat protein [Gammaproteobacteria bacterium]|nr:tetratricopeptide repeat protein [Gammaproteobacteria bacterium]MDH3374082.1 tetratricopeptide repeat protein [Gammaproteobacteria bacterium]MDH3408887.1 tetratricopeptide repeat protein [Gammaproteobacteria bacterium]MDH3553423.1 tetratricopeptide repeat protein [Gammaproteobacteria bacterium]